MKKFIASFLLIILTAAVILTGCSSSGNNAGSASEAKKEITITFIDVGKGDCILIEQGEKAMLIDTGYKKTVSDVESFLEKKGIDELECIVITHYDKDHVGGASQIIKDYSPSNVFLPNYSGSSEHYAAMKESIKETGINSIIVDEDKAFNLGDAKIYIYKSDIEYEAETESVEETDSTETYKEVEGNDNDVSLVLSCRYMDDSYLFPGDIEKLGIKGFLEKDLGNYDVLKMPHHGRYNKQTDDLIEAVAPKYAVITDSEDEPADDDTLELLSDIGAEIYSTSEDKTIEIKSNGSKEYTVKTDI